MLIAVIDIQRGFVTEESRHVLPRVIELLRHAEAAHIPFFFTRFINHPCSGFVRWVKWNKLMEPPEIELHPDILCLARFVFDKSGYTSFTEDVKAWIQDNKVTKLFCCGIATEGCVLKTAVDAFEADIEPIVIHDACASHAGRTQHEAGVFVLTRFIGKGQIRSVDEVVRSGFA